MIVYTVAGGSEAVSLTQKYQLGVIFCGMFAAFVVLLAPSCRPGWASTTPSPSPADSTS